MVQAVNTTFAINMTDYLSVYLVDKTCEKNLTIYTGDHVNLVFFASVISLF